MSSSPRKKGGKSKGPNATPVPTQSKPVVRQRGNGSPGKWFAWAQVLSTLIETFGWPGLVLILGYRFVVNDGTIEQKHQIIDVFVLGKGSTRWHEFVMAVVFVLVLLAQRGLYEKRLATKQAEVDRLAKWKTDHQDGRIETPLHSSSPGN